MLRLWSHFSRQFVGSVGCWQLQSPLSHQGTGRKRAWKIDGQAINSISGFSGKFSRNGENMLCFHFLVDRLAVVVVIPCRLMTISCPRSLALSDSISILKTFFQHNTYQDQEKYSGFRKDEPHLPGEVC